MLIPVTACANGKGTVMKICAIHATYSPSFSGAAIQFQKHAKEIVRRGHSVIVITPNFASLDEVEVVDGIQVVRFWICNRSSHFKKISFMISSLITLIKLRKDYDILHLHNFDKYYFLPLLVAKLLRKKTLYQITLIGQEPHVGDDFIAKLGLALIDRIVGLTAPIVELTKAGPAKRIPSCQLGYGIDVQRFYPLDKQERLRLKEQLRLPIDKNIICFVGSILERKGVDVLFDTFRIISNLHEDVVLLIVGPDEITKDKVSNPAPYQNFINTIKSKRIEWGLESRIVFTGFTDKVEQYLQASDIFVFPSRREGLGAVILEAMAVGLPCIVSHLDGITKTIIDNDLNGIIVDEFDPSIYASQISRLLSNKELMVSMGESAMDKIISNFTIQRVVDDYIRFYESL